jgi:hypothetical protein
MSTSAEGQIHESYHGVFREITSRGEVHHDRVNKVSLEAGEELVVMLIRTL